jgi:hypothetical protein
MRITIAGMLAAFFLCAGCGGNGGSGSDGSEDAVDADVSDDGLDLPDGEVQPSCSDDLPAITFTVKETAGTGADEFPVSVVVPLPYGYCHSADTFRLDVPAQVEVLNRWAGRDNSIRHLLVHLQASAAAGGSASYTLSASGPPDAPAVPATVTDSGGRLEVTTGPLLFHVAREGFNILDDLYLDLNADGSFHEDEKMIQGSGETGGVLLGFPDGAADHDASLGSPSIEIEEDGPMRVVLRAEVPARYNDADNDGDADDAGEFHRHGYAVRIYAYAGKPYIKVDYQLQNSAKGPALYSPDYPDCVGDETVRCGFSDPLFFRAMSVDLDLAFGDGADVRFGLGDGSVFRQGRGNGLVLAQDYHDTFTVRDATDAELASGVQADGFMDVSVADRGAAAFIRNVWQTWPNGLSVDADNRLRFELWPEWSRQVTYLCSADGSTYCFWEEDCEGDGNECRPGFTPDQVYWLDDMQHVVKEMLLYFHDGSASDPDLVNLARTFQYHPVAVVPLQWYRETQVTVDLDGVIPLDAPVGGGDRLVPEYGEGAYDFTSLHYNFGWASFFVDIDRKRYSAGTGGWPDGAERFIATEAPADWFMAEAGAMGELNVRPQWMAAYDYESDYTRIGLTQAPYAGGHWRAQDNPVTYLPGTGRNAAARDDQHGWFYHVEGFYWYSGNPWIRDWYAFVGEFRKSRLDGIELFEDSSSRGTGHALANALQAFRVTNDPDILEKMKAYAAGTLRSTVSASTGIYTGSINSDTGLAHDWGGGSGFLTRQIIDYTREFEGFDPQARAEAFQFLSAIFQWNLDYGNFAYWIDEGTVGASSGTGLPLLDPQVWYFRHTGRSGFWDHVQAYLDTGIPAGEGSQPYGDFSSWTGQWECRFLDFSRAATPPGPAPAAVTDLEASRSGSGVVLSFTAPEGAACYHVVWSDRPISEEPTTDEGEANWWAARTLGVFPSAAAGSIETVTIPDAGSAAVHAALFSFSTDDQMSGMSNAAQAD